MPPCASMVDFVDPPSFVQGLGCCGPGDDHQQGQTSDKSCFHASLHTIVARRSRTAWERRSVLSALSWRPSDQKSHSPNLSAMGSSAFNPVQKSHSTHTRSRNPTPDSPAPSRLSSGCYSAAPECRSESIPSSRRMCANLEGFARRGSAIMSRRA